MPHTTQAASQAATQNATQNNASKLVARDLHKRYGDNEVLKVMQKFADEGRTMIAVTHEMGFARNVSNHVMFLHQGRVEEAGAPADVQGNPKSERLRQFLSGNLK